MPNIVYRLPMMETYGLIEHTSLSTGYRTVKTFDSREGIVELVRPQRNSRSGSLKIIKSVRHQDANKPPREAYILSLLDRPCDNIIDLFAAERTPGKYGLMCFEYCTGGNLFDQCRVFDRAGVAVPRLFALHVFISMAEAVAFLHHGIMFNQHLSAYEKSLHARQVIHCDIKSDNVFLRFPGIRDDLPDIVLADFGMAIHYGDEFKGGCTDYLSPECRLNMTVHRRPNITHKHDIYALGVMMADILDRESGLWPLMMEPKEVAININYKGLGFTDVLRKLLVINPSERGDFSGTSGPGLLSHIYDFRKVRSEFTQSGNTMDPIFWNVQRHL